MDTLRLALSLKNIHYELGDFIQFHSQAVVVHTKKNFYLQ